MTTKNAEIDALITALATLRKIYNASIINDSGNIVIHENAYSDFYKDILIEIGKLERVIASNLSETCGHAEVTAKP